MAQSCRPGLSPRDYMRCCCMQSCGAVEDKYRIYRTGNINGLHLIAEIYDDANLHDRHREYVLTEKQYEKEKQKYLVEQKPEGGPPVEERPREITWADIVSS